MRDLASGIRQNYSSQKKMSSEYKQIKKLLPHERKTKSRFRFVTPGFFDVKEKDDAPQPLIQRFENSYWEARDEYSQAVYDHEQRTISSDELKA